VSQNQKKPRPRWVAFIKARQRAGLTQERLAELLDVSYITIRKWERGERSPKIKKLTDIARVLRCTPADLVS